MRMLFNDVFGYQVELIHTQSQSVKKCHKCDFNPNKPCPSDICVCTDNKSVTRGGYLKIINEMRKIK